MAFSDIVQKSLTPIIYINVTGMVFGALSLIWSGNFHNAWPAFAGLLMSPVIFPFLLVPAGILTGIMAITLKTHPKLEKVLTVVSVLYIVTLLSLYTIAAFYFLVGAPTLPAAIYAVCSAVAPWAIFAAKDRQNIFFTGLVLMMQLSALVLVGLNVALRLTDFTQKFLIIWGTMMFCVCIEALYEKIMLDRKKPEESKPAS